LETTIGTYDGLSQNDLYKIYRRKIESLTFARQERNRHRENALLYEMHMLEIAMGKVDSNKKKIVW